MTFMKLLKITLATIFAGSMIANAQVTDECRQDASLGIESAKVKNYKEAGPYLLKVRKNCPTYSLAIYQYSERLVRAELKTLKKAKAPLVQQQNKANELIALLKERKQYFPKETSDGDLYSDIALIMFESKLGSSEEQFNMYSKAYDVDKANFNGPKKMYTYFGLLVDLQAQGKKDIQQVFDLYDDLSDKIELEQTKKATVIQKLSSKEESGATLLSKEKKKLNRAEKVLKIYGQVENSLKAKLGKLADCPNLIPLISGQYAANENNLEWVKSSARRLYKKECTEDPLFLKLVEKQHSLEPSASTAKYLAKLAEQRGDSAASEKYYNQSIDLETDPSKKADALYAKAQSLKKKGSYSKARQYYRQALQNKPSLGGAYIQIAMMVAKSANNCGTDEFSKRATYWLAANYARKAKRVQPSLGKYADKLIANYMGSAPSKTDVFTKGMQGKSVAIGCWIGESVKVPNL